MSCPQMHIKECPRAKTDAAPTTRIGDVDAFVECGLIDTDGVTEGDKIEIRKNILRKFESDIERYAFLCDLGLSNARLFNQIVATDILMRELMIRMAALVCIESNNARFLPGDSRHDISIMIQAVL
jgi:hypothetical protein